MTTQFWKLLKMQCRQVKAESQIKRVPQFYPQNGAFFNKKSCTENMPGSERKSLLGSTFHIKEEEKIGFACVSLPRSAYSLLALFLAFFFSPCTLFIHEGNDQQSSKSFLGSKTSALQGCCTSSNPAYL